MQSSALKLQSGIGLAASFSKTTKALIRPAAAQACFIHSLLDSGSCVRHKASFCSRPSVLQQERAAGALAPAFRRNLSWHTRQKCTALRVDNRELITGDVLVLICFCLYKQITAIILHPAFPGWTAPLRFSYIRFEEFASFALTVCGAWVISSLLVGGYTLKSTADLSSSLQRVVQAWLISMPVSACQLVLTTASESHALVGSSFFAAHLPLAASGPAEPLATAAGILGLMAVWRAFYTTELDFWNMNWASGSRRLNRNQDIAHLGEALRSTALITLAASIVIQILDYTMGAGAISAFLQHIFNFSDPLT